MKKGIGGFLIVIGIYLLLRLFNDVFFLYDLLNYDLSEILHFSFLFLFVVLFVLADVFLIYLFFRKDVLFPKFFIIVLIISYIFNIVFTIIENIGYYDISKIVAAVLRSLFFVSMLITYIIVSDRVKNTFVIKSRLKGTLNSIVSNVLKFRILYIYGTILLFITIFLILDIGIKGAFFVLFAGFWIYGIGYLIDYVYGGGSTFFYLIVIIIGNLYLNGYFDNKNIIDEKRCGENEYYDDFYGKCMCQFSYVRQNGKCVLERVDKD